MIPRDNITIVLVEPRSPGNVGSVARAMANMGFTRLSLVKPCALDDPEARKMALTAWPIVESARVFGGLGEALEDQSWAVATTCRGGKLRRESTGPRELAARLADLDPGNRVALVFGPEDRGLDNAELTLCREVAAIPSDEGFPSLNLAQAVMVFLWELRAAGAGEKGDRGRILAASAALEGLYAHLAEVLTETGFLHPGHPDRMMRVLRRIIDRAALDEREARVVRGILRQARWYFRGSGADRRPGGKGTT